MDQCYRVDTNDVNGAQQSSLKSAAFGRGRPKASSVVSKRNPWMQRTAKAKEGGLLKIGSWNVRTMLRAGKLTNVIREMKRAEVEILGLCETRWKDGGDFTSDGTRVIYAGGTESQRSVAVLLGGKMMNAVESVERYGDRLQVVTIRAQPVNIVVIQVYMPTSDYPEE
jgi:hypothetical protein